MVFFEIVTAFSADNLDLGHLQLRSIVALFFQSEIVLVGT